MKTNYFQLKPGEALPEVSAFKPFLAAMVIEEPVTPEWRDHVSQWLVKSGCLYMLAWGAECEKWHDAVDWANIEQFDHGDIPEDELVMTTWHDGQALSEFFRESKDITTNSCVDFSNSLIIHISSQNKEQELLAEYLQA